MGDLTSGVGLGKRCASASQATEKRDDTSHAGYMSYRIPAFQSASRAKTKGGLCKIPLESVLCAKLPGRRVPSGYQNSCRLGGASVKSQTAEWPSKPFWPLWDCQAGLMLMTPEPVLQCRVP